MTLVRPHGNKQSHSSTNLTVVVENKGAKYSDLDGSPDCLMHRLADSDKHWAINSRCGFCKSTEVCAVLFKHPGAAKFEQKNRDGREKPWSCILTVAGNNYPQILTMASLQSAMTVLWYVNSAVFLYNYMFQPGSSAAALTSESGKKKKKKCWTDAGGDSPALYGYKCRLLFT